MLLAREANKLYFMGFDKQDWNFIVMNISKYNIRCVHVFTAYTNDIVSCWFKNLVYLVNHYRKANKLNCKVVLHTVGTKTASDVHDMIKDKSFYKESDYNIDSADSFTSFLNDRYLLVHKEYNKIIVSWTVPNKPLYYKNGTIPISKRISYSEFSCLI